MIDVRARLALVHAATLALLVPGCSSSTSSPGPASSVAVDPPPAAPEPEPPPRPADRSLPEVGWGLPDEPWVEIFYEAIDDATLAAGHPRLREQPLEPGARELRLWVGFGLRRRQQYLRLTIAPEDSDTCPKIVGEPHAWWHEAAGEACGQAARQIATEVACGPPGWGEHHGACPLKLASAPDWVTTYERLLEHRVWELPGSAHHPEHVRATDGTSLVVELREGDRFRAYEYGNPGSQRYEAARDAAAIVALVQALAAPPSSEPATGMSAAPPAAVCRSGAAKPPG